MPLFLFIAIFTVSSCAPPQEETINENIIKITDRLNKNETPGNGSNVPGDNRMGVWLDDKICSVSPLRFIYINQNFERILDSVLVADETIFPYPGVYLFLTYIALNKPRNKLLMVGSYYEDVSLGSLWEFDLVKNEIKLLRDSTYSVSSAVYFADDDNRCIYYSYGNPIGTNAGYYELDMTTGQDTLIFPYYSAIGPSEQINGFDLHPGGEILLIPVVQEAHIPQLVQYNMTTKTLDTLGVDFDLSLNRICLWVRYNSTGNQILYSNYPRFILGRGGAPDNDSDIGIIEIPSLVNRILDVNTNPGYRSMSVFPNWSPDDRHIVYGSGNVTVEGWRGDYDLFILKNVN